MPIETMNEAVIWRLVRARFEMSELELDRDESV